MIRFALLLSAAPLFAQHLAVTVTPVRADAVRPLFGSRFAKRVMLWTVAASLDGRAPAPVVLTEPAVIRKLAHLSPFDHATVSLLVDDAEKNSPSSRAGRILLDLGALGAFYAVTHTTERDVPRWGMETLRGLAIFNAYAPYLGPRIRGVAAPTRANFERLAWIEPLSIPPGGSATAHVFTAVWKNPDPVTFELDVEPLPAVRFVQ